MGSRIDLTQLDLPGQERFALGTDEESKWFEIRLPVTARRVAIKCNAAFYVRGDQRRLDGSYPASVAGVAIDTAARTVSASGIATGGDPYITLPAGSTADQFHELALGPSRPVPGGSGCSMAPVQLRPPVLFVASATAGAVFELCVQGSDGDS